MGLWTVALGLPFIAALGLLLIRRLLGGRRWHSLVYRGCYLARLRIWERRAPPADLVE